MGRSSYTQSYSGFIGLDASSDPRAVARNRLAYAINMWRDYESEQGAAIETFPGFRRVAHSLGKDEAGGEIGAVHGLYHFRSRKGIDYVVVHAGTKIYAFENEALASGNYEDIAQRSAIISEGVANSDSTGFVYNNSLYILDGSHYLRVRAVDGETANIEASVTDAYVPTTYYNGNLYEQRNMLTNLVKQLESGSGKEVEGTAFDDLFVCSFGDGAATIFGWKNINVESNVIAYVGVLGAYEGRLTFRNFSISQNLKYVYVDDAYQNHPTAPAGAIHTVSFDKECLKDCKLLKEIFINVVHDNDETIWFEENCFLGCDSLERIYLHSSWQDYQYSIKKTENIPDNVELIFLDPNDPIWNNGLKNIYPTRETKTYTVSFPIYEMATAVKAVTVDDDNDPYLSYLVEYREVEINGEKIRAVSNVMFRSEDVQNEDGSPKRISIDLELYPTHFNTIENVKSFQDGNTDYKGTSVEAINGCTKSAIFDGRVFLTGNPDLPNTVFYSHRNLTGANDPAYFGIYNYFNDGEGNSPNVDMLSTPSMLMVLKGDTVQDGSVYYHTGMNNTDENTMNILPRVYPSTQGAAGLGSAGNTVPGKISCNFFDDPVFLSKRGLEAVSKETVNLERTIQHRSSNIDRLLIRENLAKASMAGWKRYLAICCDGHIYLADSRYMIQHTDGSYQYEWYYLEGIGTYERYEPKWIYLTGQYPYVNDDRTLGEYMIAGEAIEKNYRLRSDGAELLSNATIMQITAYSPDDDTRTIELYFVEEGGVKYIVEADGEEKRGVGNFFGANKLISVGDRLMFGTGNGDICIVNTDKRGVGVNGRAIEYDRIDRSFYSFNGVPYLSGCSLRLDDCDKKSLSKTTVCGTTTARFKMMPGSHCYAMVSTNGRDWDKLGEAFSSRMDLADLEFANLSFAENENNVVVFPEISRGWINKQYYFYSDRFEAPFGIYELSYIYYVAGKIRY